MANTGGFEIVGDMLHYDNEPIARLLPAVAPSIIADAIEALLENHDAEIDEALTDGQEHIKKQVIATISSLNTKKLYTVTEIISLVAKV